jgi:DNA polymerase V
MKRLERVPVGGRRHFRRSESKPPQRKSICCSHSFGRGVTELAELSEAVCSYLSRAAEKLRQRKLAASYLSVFIRTNQFNADPKYSGGRGATISPASNNTLTLNRLAQQLLLHCYEKGFRYWKARVLQEGLVPADCVQGDLFQAADSPQQKALMRAWDRVNQRFGRETLQLAGPRLKPRWQMRRELLSPPFTTCWEELPRVKV